MTQYPWCSKCGVNWRGTPTTVVVTWSIHPVTRCPACGGELARVASRKARGVQ